MRLNENGDLVKSPGIEATEIGFFQTPGMVIATAAELKAAGLVPADELKAERDEMLNVLAAMHSVHRGFSSNDNWTILDDDARAATEALLDKHGR